MKLHQSLPDVRAHPAVENEVLRRSARGFGPVELAVLLPNYRVFTAAFPSILAGLIARCDDTVLQFQLTQILHSELGSGRLEKAHVRLFDEMVAGVGPYPTARSGPGLELVAELRRLYLHEELAVALGAQTALELQAGHMLERLGAAFVTDVDGKPRQPEFFAIHQQDEPDHERAMLACMADTDHDETQFVRGFGECLEAFASFWQGIAARMRGVSAEFDR